MSVLPAGNIPLRAALEVIGLAHKGMLLDPGQLAVYQIPYVPLCIATFQPVRPQDELVHDVIFPQVYFSSQGFCLPILQLVEVLVNGRTPICCIS